jgi:CRP-like cAMP-binding protein
MCGHLPGDTHVSRQGQLIHLARGDRLDTCREGCMRFWVVVRGTAAVCTGFADGRRQITGIEMPGDALCGLIASPEAPTWLEALEDCTICQVDFTASRAELERNPEFMREVFSLIHQRLEVTSQHLSTLGRLDSTERVILFLGQMSLRTARPNRPDDPVRLPMSREDIADYLGLNAETVSRILSRVKKTGLFKFSSPTEYVVPDMAALERRLPVPVIAAGHDPFAVANPQSGEIREIGR